MLTCVYVLTSFYSEVFYSQNERLYTDPMRNLDSTWRINGMPIFLVYTWPLIYTFGLFWATGFYLVKVLILIILFCSRGHQKILISWKGTSFGQLVRRNKGCHWPWPFVRVIQRHKKHEVAGEKATTYTNRTWRDHADAESISVNEEITWMDWGNAIVKLRRTRMKRSHTWVAFCISKDLSRPQNRSSPGYQIQVS